MKTKFVLFRKVAKSEQKETVSMFTALFGSIPGEEWKNQKPDGKKEEVLEFVCFAENPKEVAKAVRKNPLARYVLFKGEAVEIKVAMPVFADGVALDTLMSEWDE